MLWAIFERKKPMSSLNDDDAKEFAEFLLNPQPAESWVHSGITRRTADNWRPFRGPLTARSRDHCIRVLSILFEWLRKNNYIAYNPWTLVPFVANSRSRKEYAPVASSALRYHVLTLSEWDYVTAVLENLPDSEENLKAKAIIYLAYFSALKPGELCRLDVGAISVNASPTEKFSLWLLTIRERQAELSTIYLLPPAQAALSRYLSSRGLSLEALENCGDTPLFVPNNKNLNSTNNITELASARNELDRIASRIFAMAADRAKNENNIVTAHRLNKATLTWLSNAFETHVPTFNLPGNWEWQFIAAQSRLPLATRIYLPQRSKLPVSTIKRGLKILRPMWSKL